MTTEQYCIGYEDGYSAGFEDGIKPAELLATDEFYDWWGQNPSLEKQPALVKFYNKQSTADCRTCTMCRNAETHPFCTVPFEKQQCTNGDLYQPAPKVVL